MNFEFILTKIIPPFLIVLGTVTNTLVIVIYSRKRFDKLPTRNVWRLLSTVEIFCILQLTKHAAYHLFDFDIYNVSEFACKLFSYLSHFGSISAWLLVYISIDRLLAIIYARFARISNKHQTLILVLILLVNILFYAQRIFYDSLQVYENSTECWTQNQYNEAFEVFMWLDLLNSTLLPFLLMFFCSVYLIYSIFMSRRKLLMKTSCLAKRRLNRDIKFSITLVTMNVMFFVVNFPITLFLLLDSQPILWYYILDNLYYFGYCVNFFIYVAVNTTFREEFLIMLHLKTIDKKLKSSSQYNLAYLSTH